MPLRCKLTAFKADSCQIGAEAFCTTINCVQELITTMSCMLRTAKKHMLHFRLDKWLYKHRLSIHKPDQKVLMHSLLISEWAYAHACAHASCLDMVLCSEQAKPADITSLSCLGAKRQCHMWEQAS